MKIILLTLLSITIVVVLISSFAEIDSDNDDCNVRDEILVKRGKHVLAIPKKYNPIIYKNSLCQKADDSILIFENIHFNLYSSLFKEIPGISFDLSASEVDDKYTDPHSYSHIINKLESDVDTMRKSNTAGDFILFHRKYGGVFMGTIKNTDIKISGFCGTYHSNNGLSCNGNSIIFPGNKTLHGIKMTTSFSVIPMLKKWDKKGLPRDFDRSMDAWAERHRMIYDRILKWKKRAQEIMDAETHLKQTITE